MPPAAQVREALRGLRDGLGRGHGGVASGCYRARRGPNGLLSLLLADMLVINPTRRQPAEACHEKALQLLGDDADDNDDDGGSGGKRSGLATPRALPTDSPASSSQGADRASEATTILQVADDDDGRDSQRQRFRRSGAPAPDSFPQRSVVEGGL